MDILSININVLIPVLLSVILLCMILSTVFFLKCYKKPQGGKAYIRQGFGGTQVFFSGLFVLPIIHTTELIDLSVHIIPVELKGEKAVKCLDGYFAEAEFTFSMSVNLDANDIIKVQHLYGAETTFSSIRIKEVFSSKFEEAVRVVFLRYNFSDIEKNIEKIREEIVNTIGTQLNGYLLDDATFSFIHPRPLKYEQIIKYVS